MSKILLQILMTVVFIFLKADMVFGAAYCTQAYSLIKTVETHHFDPRPLDDQFSELVFDRFIENLDPYGMILTEADMEILEVSKLSLDDHLKDMDCSFVEKALKIYGDNLAFVDSLLVAFEKTSFNIHQNENLVYAKETVYGNRNKLSSHWRQGIKYDILSRYYGTIDSNKTKKAPTKKEIEAIKQEVIKSERCNLKDRLNNVETLEKYVYQKFLNAIAFAFDPHTNYFSPSEMDEFETMLSKESLSYGFDISRHESGAIEITHILPGSPAWKSNALNPGDVIVSMTSPSGKKKEFSCTGLKEAINFITSPDLNEVSLHVRKPNGREKHITLFKEIVAVDENLIQSFILENGKMVGYIYLPSFYSEADAVNLLANGCANDVAKELIKLKREGIEGLIIDLRNNTGGSMMEAIRLTGIFIDYGAVAIVQSKNEEPVTLKDMDRGILYDNPLVVIVNGFSASASEFFAAAIQDHNRGLIVGNPTFGKSTVQQLFPLDGYKYAEASNDMPESKDGYLKITTGKFFRVNGSSHQKMGVQPDIVFPSFYDPQDYGESKYASSLEATEIDKKTYYYPFPDLPLAQLMEKSKARVIDSKAFASIKKENVVAIQKEDMVNIPLRFNSFVAYMDSLQIVGQSLKPESELIVRNPSYLEGISSLDEEEKEINKNAKDEIRTDIYIHEAFHILLDLITLTEK